MSTNVATDVEGEPPEGALDIEVVDAVLVHELTLGPGSKRPIDVTKMKQRAAQTPKRYDVVAVTTDGVTVASLQAEAMRPIRIPDSGEAITVTYTPGRG